MNRVKIGYEFFSMGMDLLLRWTWVPLLSLCGGIERVTKEKMFRKTNYQLLWIFWRNWFYFLGFFPWLFRIITGGELLFIFYSATPFHFLSLRFYMHLKGIYSSSWRAFIRVSMIRDQILTTARQVNLRSVVIYSCYNCVFSFK